MAIQIYRTLWGKPEINRTFQKSQFQMASWKSAAIFICVLALVGTTVAEESDLIMTESRKVQSLERAISESVEMDYSDYKFYPFAINSTQEFVIRQEQTKEVKGAVSLKWIDRENDVLKYPIFDREEFLKVKIVEQETRRTVQERSFHFQTAFKFTAEAHRKYRVIFINNGNWGKMIEFVVNYEEPFSHKFNNHANTTASIQQSSEAIKKVRASIEALTHISEQTLMNDGTIHDKVANNMQKFFNWTLWEIILFAGLAIAQLWMVGHELKNNSSVV